MALSKPRGRLFRKYVVLFVTLVSGALVTSGLVEIYFSYQENKTALGRIQREKAQAAAAKIEQFIKEIERQIGWTTQAQWGARSMALDQRRFDYLRLLKQSPAVTEISQLDTAGKEQLRVSRLAMDVAGSQTDFSQEPKFVEAKAGKIYFSPVYFRKESEPYMTVSMPRSGEDPGVTVAEVNLKFIWEVVSQIKVGKAGQAYVVDSRGQLIAHPDISLVLQKTDLSALPHV
ncbi:MAG: cache domain-containing protein, partial [candidate division NC10 bacterium]